MNRILLASHGVLASGMKQTLQLFVGESDRIEVMCAYVEDDMRSVVERIDEWNAQRSPEDWWIVVTDIFGGSVNNEFFARKANDTFALIAGMNLGLLVELSTMLDRIGPEDLGGLVARNRESILLCEKIEPTTCDIEDF